MTREELSESQSYNDFINLTPEPTGKFAQTWATRVLVCLRKAFPNDYEVVFQEFCQLPFDWRKRVTFLCDWLSSHGIIVPESVLAELQQILDEDEEIAADAKAFAKGTHADSYEEYDDGLPTPEPRLTKFVFDTVQAVFPCTRSLPIPVLAEVLKHFRSNIYNERENATLMLLDDCDSLTPESASDLIERITPAFSEYDVVTFLNEQLAHLSEEQKQLAYMALPVGYVYLSKQELSDIVDKILASDLSKTADKIKERQELLGVRGDDVYDEDDYEFTENPISGANYLFESVGEPKTQASSSSSISVDATAPFDATAYFYEQTACLPQEQRLQVMQQLPENWTTLSKEDLHKVLVAAVRATL